jgi:hypothetical protein
MTENNKIFFCTRTPIIYEVAKKNEIDKRMNKENDIKYKNNIWQNYENCYPKKSNNPQDWPDACTNLVPPRNDLLIPIILNCNAGQ